jgi:hypothetical protein
MKSLSSFNQLIKDLDAAGNIEGIHELLTKGRAEKRDRQLIAKYHAINHFTRILQDPTVPIQDRVRAQYQIQSLQEHGKLYTQDEDTIKDSKMILMPAKYMSWEVGPASRQKKVGKVKQQEKLKPSALQVKEQEAATKQPLSAVKPVEDTNSDFQEDIEQPRRLAGAEQQVEKQPSLFPQHHNEYHAIYSPHITEEQFHGADENARIALFNHVIGDLKQRGYNPDLQSKVSQQKQEPQRPIVAPPPPPKMPQQESQFKPSSSAVAQSTTDTASKIKKSLLNIKDLVSAIKKSV